MSGRWKAWFPPGRRDWAEAYTAEFGAGGLVRVLLAAWWLQIKGGNRMRTVLATLSVVNCLFGGFVLALFFTTGPNPPLVVILAASLIMQGGYTLWFLRSTDRPMARGLLLAGETVAILVGFGGLSSIVLETASGNSHPEYGPLAVAGLITAQAAVALYEYAIKSGDQSLSR